MENPFFEVVGSQSLLCSATSVKTSIRPNGMANQLSSGGKNRGKLHTNGIDREGFVFGLCNHSASRYGPPAPVPLSCMLPNIRNDNVIRPLWFYCVSRVEGEQGLRRLPRDNARRKLTQRKQNVNKCSYQGRLVKETETFEASKIVLCSFKSLV